MFQMLIVPLVVTAVSICSSLYWITFSSQTFVSTAWTSSSSDQALMTGKIDINDFNSKHGQDRPNGDGVNSFSVINSANSSDPYSLVTDSPTDDGQISSPLSKPTSTDNATVSLLTECPRHYLFHNGKQCLQSPDTPKDFIGVDRPIYIYGYSAHLFPGEGRVAMILLYSIPMNKQFPNIKCDFQFPGSENWVQGFIGGYYQSFIPFDKNNYGTIHSAMYMCRYRKVSRDVVAQYVRIRTRSEGTVLSILPVEELVKPPKRKSLALCLPRVYQKPYCADCQGFNYTYFLPEWMEMQRIMGVDKVYVYNVSMNSDASLIFSHYARQGFVEILSHHPIHDETYMPVSMGLTDCMYRNRFMYDYVLALDMDEFIFSKKLNTYQEIIAELFRNGTHKHVRVTLGHFLTNDDQKYRDAEPYLKTALFRNYNLSGYHGSGKTFMNPRECGMASAHTCVMNLQVLDVDPSVALIHHYKGCSFREVEMKRQCETSPQLMMKTDIGMKYHNRLKRAVHNTFRELKLWGF